MLTNMKDTTEDKSFNGGGEHAVQGERDQVCDPQEPAEEDVPGNHRQFSGPAMFSLIWASK